MIYDGVRATDAVNAGDVFRVTYISTAWINDIADDARDVWERVASSGYAFSITQPSVSGKAAAWDVKASARAAGVPVSVLANAIARLHPNLTLDRVQRITQGMAFAPSAPLAREAEAERASVTNSIAVKAADAIDSIGLPSLAANIRNISAGVLVIAGLAVILLLAREARYWR